MSDKEQAEDFGKSRSTKTMASYGFGKFLFEFVTGAFAAIVFKFYETNMELDPLVTALGIIIYSIWNAVNDPLIGWFTTRPTKYAKKHGRRYPWIVLGLFLWPVSFIAIFLVPESLKGNQLPVFLWMILSTCLYDTFGSLWEVNYQSVFPDKFRKKKDRDKAAGIATIIGVFGIALGFLVHSQIIDYEDKSSFVINGVIYAVIAFVISFLMLPGVKEDKGMIRRYLDFVEREKDIEVPSFKDQLRKAFKQRNFLAFILLYLFYQAATMSMTSSIHYVGDYILPEDASDTTIIFAGMLVGALLSVPLWLKLSRKYKDNQKLLTVAAFAMAAFTFPMTFVNSQIGFTISLLIFGVSFGGFWLIMTPAMADVIDEIVVQEKERRDGVYLGFRAFFGRLAYAAQAISFGVVHELTGFVNVAGAEQTEFAKLGIHLHMATIPAIFLIIGGLLFMKLNTLNKKKMDIIHRELAELNL